jgi:LPXTG-motif cell wall-anchored protein
LRRWLFRLAVPATVVVAALVPAVGTAWANTTININPGNVKNGGTTAAKFGGNDCDSNFGGPRKANQDIWIFVLPGNSGTWVSLTAHFNTGSGTTDVTIPPTDAHNNFALDNGTPKAFLTTAAGWTLTGASAVVSGDTKDFFNLTGTCAASGRTPTGTPTSPSTTTTAPRGGGSSSGGGSPDGSLPTTGVAVTGIIIAGLVLIGGGSALLIARRRMDRAHNSTP